MITPRTQSQARDYKGFTFVEIMFVLLIMGFVSIGLYQFAVDTSRALFTSTEKNEIADDIRQFTGEMEGVAKSANFAYVYTSFQANDRNDITDRRRDGQSGDCVIFVFVEANSNPLNPDLITKIVGYFRRPDTSDAEGRGPVLKFEKKFSPGRSVATYTPESLIADLAYSDDYPNVVELSKGLASGKLFYNYLDRSVMIKAEIIHGNAAKRVTDTYNFTVSPRG
jgi:type II secretory pathway component PulJ